MGWNESINYILLFVNQRYKKLVHLTSITNNMQIHFMVKHEMLLNFKTNLNYKHEMIECLRK